MRFEEDEENECVKYDRCQEIIGVRELMIGDLADASPFRFVVEQRIVC